MTPNETERLRAQLADTIAQREDAEARARHAEKQAFNLQVKLTAIKALLAGHPSE